MRKVFKPILFVVGVMLIIFLAGLWLATIAGLIFGTSFSGFLFPGSAGISTLGVVNVLMVIGIPLLMLILTVMRLFLRSNFKPRWAGGLWLFWVANIVSSFAVAMFAIKDINTTADVPMGIRAVVPANVDTLVIDMTENPYRDNMVRLGNATIGDNMLISDNIRINVERSENGEFSISDERFSRGANTAEASALAQKIDYQFNLEGNRLTMPSYFAIPQGEKWRGQLVRITLKVPDGKWVKRTEHVNGHIFNVHQKEGEDFHWWGYNEHAWLMTADGMVCPALQMEREAEKAKEREKMKGKEVSGLSDFSKIRVDGPIEVRIERGDKYAVRLLGSDEMEEHVHVGVSGNRLTITCEHTHDEMSVEITVPSLEELEATEQANVSLRDFSLEKLRLLLDGNSEIKAYSDIRELIVEMDGNGKLELHGKGNHLQATLTGGASLDAGRYEVKVADTDLTGGARAVVSAIDSLLQHVEEGSSLEARGKPGVVIER